jgi:hypothetical protein
MWTRALIVVPIIVEGLMNCEDSEEGVENCEDSEEGVAALVPSLETRCVSYPNE